LLLRPGEITIEEIEKVIGKVRIPCSNPKNLLLQDSLPRHYSPKTPLKILTHNLKLPKKKRIGLLAFRFSIKGPFVATEILSPSGNLEEAAANFFEALHRLDSMKLDLIVAEPAPETGLGRAIMDRLHRASAAGM